MHGIHCALFLVACALPGPVLGQTPVHKCKDAQGNVVYSQLPCKDEIPAKSDESADAKEAEQPEPETPTAPPPRTDGAQRESQSDENRAACRKRYRDAIDEIDAEIRREYTAEKDGEYKQRLLALTRNLREC